VRHCGKAIEPIENYLAPKRAVCSIPIACKPQREQIAGRAYDAQAITLNALKILRYLQTREWDTSARSAPEWRSDVRGRSTDVTVHHASPRAQFEERRVFARSKDKCRFGIKRWWDDEHPRFA